LSHNNQRYFDEWEIMREELLQLIRNKDPKKSELMRKGIHQLMYILDETEEATPLNYMERTTFIKSNIDKHVAFVQLDELFKETKKKLARIRAQSKSE